MYLSSLRTDTQVLERSRPWLCSNGAKQTSTSAPVQSADRHTSTKMFLYLSKAETVKTGSTGAPVQSADRHTSTMKTLNLSCAGITV